MGRPALGVVGFVAHHEHRDVRVVHDVLADRADDHPLQPTLAVRSDHDHVDVELAGDVDDHLPRRSFDQLAVHDGRVDADGGDGVVELRIAGAEQRSAGLFGFGGRQQVAFEATGAGVLRDAGVGDGQQRDLGGVQQGDALAGSFDRDVGTVGGDERVHWTSRGPGRSRVSTP